jgi:hypothetical protein
MKDANGVDISVGDSVAIIHKTFVDLGHVTTLNYREKTISMDVSKVIHSGRDAEPRRMSVHSIPAHWVLVLK